MKKFIQLNAFFLFALCIALPITNTFETSYLYSLFVVIIFLFTSIGALLLKNQTKKISIPILLVLSTLLVVLLQLFLGENIKPLYNALGIYIPLISIVSIFLVQSLYDQYTISNIGKTSAIYSVIITLIGAIREILGSGTITYLDKISDFTGIYLKYRVIESNFYMPFFTELSSAFILLGIIAYLINVATDRGEIE